MSTLRFISTAPFLGLVLTGLLAIRVDFAAASLNVSEWRLESGVDDASGNIPILDFSNFGTVQNPFTASAENAVGPNTASTAYDFSWSGDSGSFDVTTALNVETLRVSAISRGDIIFAPTTDLRMSIDASLDYASVPGDLANISFIMTVFDAATFTVLFSQHRNGGNLTLEPAAGTLTFGGDVVLPTGRTYRTQFTTESDTSNEDNPSGPVTASGFIHFAFQPIPEPATAWLFALGAIALRRQRRTRRCRRR